MAEQQPDEEEELNNINNNNNNNSSIEKDEQGTTTSDLLQNTERSKRKQRVSFSEIIDVHVFQEVEDEDEDELSQFFRDMCSDVDDVAKGSHSKASKDTRLKVRPRRHPVITKRIGKAKGTVAQDQNVEKMVVRNCSLGLREESLNSLRLNALSADDNKDLLTSTPSYPTKESELHLVGENNSSATNLKGVVDVEPVNDGIHDRAAAEAESFPNTELNNANGYSYSTIPIEEAPHISDDGLADHASFPNQAQSSDHVQQEDHQFNPSKDSIDDGPNTKVCDSNGYNEEETSKGLRQDSPIPYGSDQQLLSPSTASKSSVAMQGHVSCPQKEAEDVTFQTPLRGIEASNNHLGSGSPDKSLQTERGPDVFRMTLRGGKHISYPAVESLHKKELRLPSRKQSGIKTSKWPKRRRDKVQTQESDDEGSLSHRDGICGMKKAKKAKKDDTWEDKHNLWWDNAMDRELAKALGDERNLGNQSNGKLTTSGYYSAARNLSIRLGRDITADNVRNRLVSWKKNYATVSNILSQRGFSWDSSKQMIAVDDESVWDNYVKHHKNEKCFRGKIIPNWDGISDYFAKEQATNVPLDAEGDMVNETNSNGDALLADDDTDMPMPTSTPSYPTKESEIPTYGVNPKDSVDVADDNQGLWSPTRKHSGDVFDETPLEANSGGMLKETQLDANNGVMLNSTDPIRNNQSNNSMTRSTEHHKLSKSLPSKTTGCSTLKIIGRIEKMEKAITTLANSMDVQSNPKPKGVDIDDLYDTVSMIPDLSEDAFFRVCDWLMEDEKKFQFLKKLPEDKRKSYVLRFTSQNST